MCRVAATVFDIARDRFERTVKGTKGTADSLCVLLGDLHCPIWQPIKQAASRRSVAAQELSKSCTQGFRHDGCRARGEAAATTAPLSLVVRTTGSRSRRTQRGLQSPQGAPLLTGNRTPSQPARSRSERRSVSPLWSPENRISVACTHGVLQGMRAPQTFGERCGRQSRRNPRRSRRTGQGRSPSWSPATSHNLQLTNCYG